MSFGFVGHHCRDITRNEAKCIPSVVQLLLTNGPFYKNLITCGPRRQMMYKQQGSQDLKLKKKVSECFIEIITQ